MIYENILIMNGASSHLEQEIADRKRTLEMVERLRGIDADLDEVLEAILYIKGEKEMLLYSHDLFREFGIANNPAIKDLEEKQKKMLAILRSDKSVDSLLEAVMSLKKGEAI